MEAKDIRNATLEAIYWWNRNENYYYLHFKNIEKIYNNKSDLEFFTTKIFEVFLKEYSVRRNLSKGSKIVDDFITQLIDKDFFRLVKKGEVEVIDKISKLLKKEDRVTGRQTISLLSKIAFLINPVEFSLYDRLAKESLWEINKNKNNFEKKSLSTYSNFIKEMDELLKLSENALNTHLDILKKFKDTPAYEYFSQNPIAFKRRILDKYLWIRHQNQNQSNRKIYNEPYLKFSKIH
jgi:hypothetical protein